MNSFRGQLTEPGAIEVARYSKGKFKIICKTFDGLYFITFHNGRYSATTRYTDNKDEANNWVLEHAIKDGFKKH